MSRRSEWQLQLRIPSFLQSSTDVRISDSSQKLLANTSAHFKRKTDTNTKYMPSSLSNSFFPHPPPFLPLTNWTLLLPCPPRIFRSPCTHTLCNFQPGGLPIAYALQKPPLLCIQPPPPASYQNITAPRGHSALWPDAVNLSQ